jgi:hypothetical protein
MSSHSPPPEIDTSNPTSVVPCGPPNKGTIGAYVINPDGSLTANGIVST